MGLADIREQIKATLSGVSGAGVVHDYERWANTWQKFLDLFKDADDKINGWTLSRIKVAQGMGSFSQIERAHIFRLQKVYGLKDGDESGIVFEDHLQAVVDAFDADDTLGGTCTTCTPNWGPMEGLTGLQIEKAEARTFGSVLCHYGECRLCAIEFVED